MTQKANFDRIAIERKAMRKAIEVKNLTKRFGDLAAVDNISFEVFEGEVFGFLGPNGAGKTTTILILTTLLAPTSGEAKVAGFDVAREKDMVRGSIGLIFQEPSLDEDLTALENLKIHAVLYHLSKDLYQQRSEEMLKMVELYDRRGELVRNFSGGMKRRLEVARGLFHHPEVLFMDEPTLGLDPQTRSRIWDYVLGLHKRENITLFMTTHYMEEAEHCDRVAVIDYGKLVAVGTPRQLKGKTKTKTMNDVFLELTGRDIRDEGASRIERMKSRMGRFH